jgi:Putative F0F1-ATPase subunit Ca2+/Mg2+ transporter
MQDNNQKKKQRNKWLALINIPIQMGVVIFAFAYAGNWLDDKYPNKHNIYVKILTLLSIVIAFYNLNRQLKEINKMDE